MIDFDFCAVEIAGAEDRLRDDVPGICFLPQV